MQQSPIISVLHVRNNFIIFSSWPKDVGGGVIALNGSPERHLPYWIPQCYLPPDTGKCAPPQAQPDRPVLDLPIPVRDGRLSWPGGWLYTEMVYLPAGNHPSQY